ncbi:hypothetical protein ANN_19906 [Periplaneta americana]|uniref:Laccase n=1 Tax=Periplaneta americana TaxID=6978 RepID=A0ABQ8SB53_PERAM|nr:hypothetical protein ANN_19906 [Periplaneta americana]
MQWMHFTSPRPKMFRNFTTAVKVKLMQFLDSEGSLFCYFTVCLGDRIIVDVINGLLAKTNTMHWHGVFQKGTPYSDGVPMVTQCPINEGATFRYDFYANNPGTFYYHSHDGLQKLDGLQGNLVIRRTKEQDPSSSLYDYDLPAHEVFVTDWFHAPASQDFPGRIHREITMYARQYLINGKGRYTDAEFGNTTKTPYAEFRVVPGNRYRFRIIAGICTECPASVTFEGHRVTLIATDGVAVQPVTVDSVHIYSGERYDVVLEASKEVKAYWIQVRGLPPCNKVKSQQLAVLKYEGSNEDEPLNPKPTYDHFLPSGLVLNPNNATCAPGQNGVCVSQLQSADKFPERILTNDPDVNVPFTFGYHFPTNEEEFWSHQYHLYIQPEPPLTIYTWVNHIFFTTPPMPVMSQLSEIPDSAYCPKDQRTGFSTCPEGPDGVCNCLNIIRVPLNSVIQFILIDKSAGAALQHPFHLHGYAFNVMAMGHLNESLQNEEDIAQLIKSNKLTHTAAPAFKDTIAVPAVGYAVVRIVTDNPGYWFFHCHFAYHLVAGMAVVIQVGDPEDNPQFLQDSLNVGISYQM